MEGEFLRFEADRKRKDEEDRIRREQVQRRAAELQRETCRKPTKTKESSEEEERKLGE